MYKHNSNALLSPLLAWLQLHACILFFYYYTTLLFRTLGTYKVYLQYIYTVKYIPLQPSKAAAHLSFSPRLKYTWVMCNKASDYDRKIHQYDRAQGNIAWDCQSAEQMAEASTGYSTKTMGLIGCLSVKRQQLAGLTADRRGCWKGARFLT